MSVGVRFHQHPHPDTHTYTLTPTPIPTPAPSRFIAGTSYITNSFFVIL